VVWNYGDLFDSCAEALPPSFPAVIHGDRTVSWGELSSRSNNLAADFLAQGAKTGDKIAIYMRNCPEYVEILVACFKARLVPVNVNYRYRDDELRYILENSDAVAVIYDTQFLDHIESLTPKFPAMRWLAMGSSYESIVCAGTGQALDLERSSDDLLFIYTGGTTGMPKAVMWRSEDIWLALGAGAAAPCNEGAVPDSAQQHADNLRRYDGRFRQLVACPLMHGTGLLTSMSALAGGGCLVTLTEQGLDVEELWDTVQAKSVTSLIIVGDAFAKPMLNALNLSPKRWDISSLQLVVSSGVMWSPEVKDGLLAHNNRMLLLDTFGSSEAVGFGSSMTTAGEKTEVAKFVVGPDCKVFDEDFAEVIPGSGVPGFIARPGPIPLGYYKDAKKTAATFPTINGVRYSIPGDWCTVEKDGTLTLLGRGSACINSAGEKIFPEEVEELLKTHASVEDALVFGIEDDKWGQAVTAVVSLSGNESLDVAELVNHVRGSLAPYKSPKAIYAVETMFRAPNGKADYKAAKAYIETQQQD
jgi:acyl-CoA synthetase (AMP-forming)/AMP-acid ligase II